MEGFEALFVILGVVFAYLLAHVLFFGVIALVTSWVFDGSTWAKNSREEEDDPIALGF